MIIVLGTDATEEQVNHIIEKIKSLGLAVHVSKGKERTIIGAIGDESVLEGQPLEILPGVEKVMPILKPYKLVSREFQKEDTIIDVGGVKIGGKEIQIIAGPCSIETKGLLFDAANSVKKAGARLLRGGAFKPRTSPYAFQGLGEEGLKYLWDARKETGMPVVTELMDPREMDKPVLLNRGLSATIKEFLMSAEYVAAQGNHKIMLCERGIRTFETAVRNTLDLSAVPVLKEETHLPVIVDPSHAVGRWDFVAPLSKAAIAVGADGLMIEVHSDPENALCDGAQSLKPDKFADLMKELKKIAEAVGRTM